MKKLLLSLLAVLSVFASWSYADSINTTGVSITEPVKVVGTANYFRITGFTYVGDLNTTLFRVDCSVGIWTDKSVEAVVQDGVVVTPAISADGLVTGDEVRWIKSWSVNMTDAEIAQAMVSRTTGGTMFTEMQTMLYNYLRSKGEVPTGF